VPSTQPADSLRIRVRRAGTGLPAVFSHGLGDSAATWSELLRTLPAGFEALTWDLLGHGDSARPEATDAYDREVALADLDRVIEIAGSDVILIGHSLGGYLSQCRVIRNPRGVRALVLIASGPGFADPKRRERWNHTVGEAAGRFDIPAAAVRMAEQHDDLVMANLDGIRLPVLQIVGERDAAYHGAFEYLKRRVQGIESLMVPGAGHHVHRTHADEVGSALASFLEKLAAARSPNR
jgi:pimeloyl-ACP methyl ester carboxylesterase